MRIKPQLIWAANHRQFKSGKKLKQSKKKGAQPQYAENVDMVLSSQKIHDILTIWRNKDIFSVTKAVETGTIASNRYQLTSTPSGHVVVGILAVLLHDTFSVTINDYLGAQSRSFSGNTLRPMYRFESLIAPVFDPTLQSKFPFPYVYGMNLFAQTQFPVITFNPGTFPSLNGKQVDVWFAHVDSNHLPLSAINCGFEPELADNSAVYTPLPTQQLSYADCAGLGSTALDLGATDSLPQLTVEATGNYAISEFGECNIADVVQYVLGMGDNPFGGFGEMLTVADSVFRSANIQNFLGDLTQLRNFSQAYDLFISRYFDTQQQARDYIQEFLDIANCEAFWSEQQLKFVPRCEVSQYGNGAFYQPACSFGPIFDLGPNDFVAEKGKFPIEIVRANQVDRPNIAPVEHMDALNNYQTAVSTWQDQLDIYNYGATKDTTKTLHSIMRHDAGQQVASMIVKRSVTQPVTYKFELPARFSFFEQMDVVTLTEPNFGFLKVPVRFIKIEDQPNFSLKCEVEPLLYGANSPVVVNVAQNSSTAIPTNALPGNITDFLIFDLPARLKQTSAPVELGIAACSVNPAWGGCAVLISDNNVDFILAGTIQGNSNMGVLTTAYPSSSVDPDTTDTLQIDFQESGAAISPATSAQQDNFVPLIYLQSASGPGEIVSYQSATLVSGDKYNFGPPIRRFVYGTPSSSHAIGERAALIDSQILHLGLQPQFIGVTLYFKFLSFNTYGQEQQDQGVVTSVTYTPNGGGQPPAFCTITPSVVTSQGSGASNNQITVAPFTAIFQSGQVTYRGFTISIATPSAPTDYWVTIQDPGQIGEGSGHPALNYFADTNPNRANSIGFTYCGKITVTVPGGAVGGAGGSTGPR